MAMAARIPMIPDDRRDDHQLYQREAALALRYPAAPVPPVSDAVLPISEFLQSHVHSRCRTWRREPVACFAAAYGRRPDERSRSHDGLRRRTRRGMSVARRRSRPVFLELVPELAEAHAQELRSARLHAGRPRERHLDVALLDLVERRLEIEPAFRNLDGNVLDVAGTAQIGRQRVCVQHLAAAEDERALDHVLELADVARPAIALEDRE